MPPVGAIKAGGAFVELFADDSKLVRGLNAAAYKLKAFGASVSDMGRKMAMLGGVALGGMFGAAKHFAAVGDEMAKMSKRTGVSVEALSGLKYAANLSGTSIESLETSLKRMQRVVTEAGQGSREAQDALANLGLTAGELAGLSPEEQFARIADSLAAIEDPTARAAAAMEVFGRSGTDLLPMLAGGSAGLKKFQKEAERLGLILTAKDARAAEEFNDALARMWASVKMAAFHVGAALAPTLKQLAERFMESIRGISDWIKQNQGLIVTALKVAAAVTVLGIALMTLGKVVGVIGGVIAAIRSLCAALTFLAIHPVIALLAALAAVAVGTALAIKLLTSRTVELADEMSKLRQAGDRQRQEDMLRLERLEQLSKQEKLNTAEMKESRELITSLSGRYGELGIRLDETAGKLYGVAAAQAAVTAEMKKAAVTELDKEIAEIQKNLAALYKEQEGYLDQSLLLSFFRSGAEGLEKLGKQMGAEYAKWEELEKRKAALLGGDKAALTGAPPEDLKARIAAGKTVAQAAEDWERRVHQLRLGQIADEFAREKALIDERYDHELAAAKKAGASQATLAKINEARGIEQAELAAKRKLQLADLEEDWKRRAGQAAIARIKDELAREQAAINEEYDAEDKKLRQAGATQATLDAARAARAQALTAAQEKADERAAEKKKQLDEANLARREGVEELRLRTTLKGIELEKALLELERKRALERAAAAGEDLELVREEFALRKKLLGLKGMGKGAGILVSFQKARLLPYLGGDSGDRIASATEQTVKEVKGLRKDVRDNQAVFD